MCGSQLRPIPFVKFYFVMLQNVKLILFLLFFLIYADLQGQITFSLDDSYSQPPDTIIINLSTLSQKDTIIILGYIADCGEFGGHSEHIKVFKDHLNLKAILNREPPCEQKTIARSYDDTVGIDKTKEGILYRYFQEYGILAVSGHGSSNAHTWFRIILNKKSFYREDPFGRWPGFINLRDKLFQKAEH